jgi:hypothetical protein
MYCICLLRWIVQALYRLVKRKRKKRRCSTVVETSIVHKSLPFGGVWSFMKRTGGRPEGRRPIYPQICFFLFLFPSFFWFSQSKLMDDLVYFCLAVEARDQNAALIATIVCTKEILFTLTLNHSHILK